MSGERVRERGSKQTREQASKYIIIAVELGGWMDSVEDIYLLCDFHFILFHFIEFPYTMFSVWRQTRMERKEKARERLARVMRHGTLDL